MKYLLLLLALPALAQFSGFTTNYDGSKLYFVSILRQRNTNQPLHGKVFSLDDRELKSVLVLDHIKLNDSWSNYSNILAPYLDSTGELAGTNAFRTCYLGFFQACKDAEGSTWRGIQFRGNLTFSPNRRYALNSIWGGLSDFYFALLDLSNGKQVATAYGFSGSHAVTDDGTVWRNGGEGIQRLTPGAAAFESITLDRGRFVGGIASIPGTHKVLVWTHVNSLSQVLEINTDTKTESPIGPSLPLLCTSITAAVQSVRIATCKSDQDVQLLRLDSPQSEWRIIAPSIRSWTLSGDGTVIWYLSSDNAFHKVNLLAETDETRLPPIGGVDASYTPTSPGSLFYINGEGIRDASLFLKRGAESIELIPVARRDRQLVYQIPPTFTFPLGDYSFEIVNSMPSHFEIRQTLAARLEPVYPLFFTTPAGSFLSTPANLALNPVAVDVNFSLLITRQNPARPGQTIHLWAVNLGPYEQGRLTTPNFACFGNDQLNPQILYAGPAPGITGIYQVSVRLPDTFPAVHPVDPVYYFACGFSGAFPLSASITVPVRP